jgi:LysM repeat protein
MKMKKKIAGGILAFSLASQAFVLPIEAVAATPNQIEATAKDYLGVPYVWGGESPSGFDCSGYIQYVFNKNGISMPRTAAEQYNIGAPVSLDDLQKGDLVFFTTYKAGPSHVGIYLGNGKFINASSSKGVSIASLSDSYWSKRYIGAKRILVGNTSLTAHIEVVPKKDSSYKQSTGNQRNVAVPQVKEEERKLNKDGKTYTVREGDTLYDIANHFKVSWNRLMLLNELDSTVIHKGQTLIIYGKLKPTIELLNISNNEKNAILPNATFHPDESFLLFAEHPIERAESATALHYLLTTLSVERESQKEETPTKQPVTIVDIPDTHWAKSSIDWAVQNKYMTTDEHGFFNPKQPLTADEANQILQLVLDNYSVPKEQKEIIINNMQKDKNWAYFYMEHLIYKISIELTSNKTADTSETLTNEKTTEQQADTVSPERFMASERVAQMVQPMFLPNASLRLVEKKNDQNKDYPVLKSSK